MLSAVTKNNIFYGSGNLPQRLILRAKKTLFFIAAA
jgi:hypothetical protein